MKYNRYVIDVLKICIHLYMYILNEKKIANQIVTVVTANCNNVMITWSHKSMFYYYNNNNNNLWLFSIY